MKKLFLVVLTVSLSACEAKFQFKAHSNCGRDTTVVLRSVGGDSTRTVRLTPVCKDTGRAG